ncbi:MAG TPA: hypothetical protein VGX68_09390 [Thermoanaerobaculia bacterium]|jgi:hypothetical protein|nr:hypothetical protein [Thermoanaerobaculia bacterium]
MKRTLRLITLTGATLLVSWALSLRPAYARPSCENLWGAPCSPNGSQIDCTWTDGWEPFPGHCWCTDGLWECV